MQLIDTENRITKSNSASVLHTKSILFKVQQTQIITIIIFTKSHDVLSKNAGERGRCIKEVSI